MAGVSVADIMRSIELQQSSIGAGMQETAKSTEEIIAISQQQAADATNAARDAAIVTSAEQAGKLEKQAKDARVLQELKVHEIMSTLAPQIQADFAALDSINRKITEKQSVGFLDNPLSWLYNQVTLDQDIAEYNGLADSVNNKTDYIKTINGLAQEAAKTTLATMQTVSEASAAAAARISAFAYTSKANDALVAAQNANINGIAQLRNMGQQQLQNNITALNVLNEEKMMRMREAEFAAGQQYRIAQLKELEKKDDFETQSLNIVNAGRTVLGQRPFSSVKEFQLWAGTTEGKAYQNQVFDVGYQALESAANGKGNVVLSPNAGEAAALLTDTRGKLAPSMQKTERLLTDTYTAVLQGRTQAVGADGMPVDIKKNPTALKGVVTSKLLESAKQMQNDIGKDKENNIYALPTFNALVEAVPAIKSNPVFAKLIAPELAAGVMKEIDPQQVMDRVVQAVANKEITYKEATKGLNELFGAAKLTNNVLNGYDKVGLPPQTSAKTTVSYNSGDSLASRTSKSKVDLFNETEVNSILTKALASKLTIDMFTNPAALGRMSRGE